MLIEPAADPTRKSKRNVRRIRRMWHDPDGNPLSLGCIKCPERAVCGGLNVAAASFGCLSFCCGLPATCRHVCRRSPSAFAHRIWEIKGFELDESIPRAPVLLAPDLPQVIPIIFHRGGRAMDIAPVAAALPLSAMFRRRDGNPRFEEPERLRRAYRLAQETRVILTGTDEDSPIERFWELGEIGRRRIIRALKTASVSLVTTPNFSVAVNTPRWDDLHAIKRIGIVHSEFLSEGMPAALHVNGRTDADFKRWAEYIASREEVTHIAYEFRTIAPLRRPQHAAWLAQMAKSVGRPLHLVIRSGTRLLDSLMPSFARLTLLETDSFMKTIKRYRAVAARDSGLEWSSAPTDPNAPLDALSLYNRESVRAWTEALIAKVANKNAR